MICTLVMGALMVAQASQLSSLEFVPSLESGNREYLKQVHTRTEYINTHGIKVNAWPRKVDVSISGGIGLIVPDGVFVRPGDLQCNH